MQFLFVHPMYLNINFNAELPTCYVSQHGSCGQDFIAYVACMCWEFIVCCVL